MKSVNKAVGDLVAFAICLYAVFAAGVLHGHISIADGVVSLASQVGQTITEPVAAAADAVTPPAPKATGPADCTSRTTWAASFLARLGYPQTTANMNSIEAWEFKEGGGPWYRHPGAAWNPINTTMPAAGATSFNSVGVRNYVSCAQGLNETVRTLHGKPYGDIRAGLANGSGNIRHAASLNTWGTHFIP